MKTTTLIAYLALLAGLAHAPEVVLPRGSMMESARQIVRRIALLERVRPDDLRTIWWLESRERVRSRDGGDGESGPFQVMEIAAIEAKCAPGWRDDFTLNAQCGAKYLRLGYERCGRQIGWAAHFYNRGNCPVRGKIYAYAMEAQRAKARITMRRES